MDRCREEPTDGERIACLEAALSGDAAAPESTPPPPAATVPPERPSGAVPAPGPAAKPEANAGAASGIGAEQVRGRSSSADGLAAARGLQVASYDTVPFRRLQVELENGQVWRQIEGDTQRIRVRLVERNRTVDIEESGLGGYKLRLNEIGRTIRVERVR